MKGYCTVQDVRWALAPLDQQEDLATAARLQDSQLMDAITEAEGIVDSYVLVRYTISLVFVNVAPDPDFPDTLVQVEVASNPIRNATRSIAAFLAALTNNKGRDMTEDDPIRLRYGVAMGLLKDIREGKSNLDEAVFPPVNQSGEVTVLNLYEGNLFDMSDVGIGPAGSNPQVYIPYRGW